MSDVVKMVFYVQGTLAANHTFVFKTDRLMTLTHVSASNSTANAGKVDVGTTSDADAYLDNQDFGVSDAPATYTKANFVGTQPVAIPAGTTVIVTVTDHGSHMAAACVVLTFEV